MNIIDALVEYFAPTAAAKRAYARHIIKAYEGAEVNRFRDPRLSRRSANASVAKGAEAIRANMRSLEEDYDLIDGALTVFVTHTIGANGIQVEPQPRRFDGEIHTECAAQINDLRDDWMKRPDVTRQHSWAECERLMMRSMARDGECFMQHVAGRNVRIQHPTAIPYSFEMLEADFCPLTHNKPDEGIAQGIQLSAWMRPLNYYFYLSHPGDTYTGAYTSVYGFNNTVELRSPVPATRIAHLKAVKRLHQIRGVSIFASGLVRIEDLKDYESSERISAKMASTPALIRKREAMGAIAEYDPDADPAEAIKQVSKGLMFMDLKPGEDVHMLEATRPSPLLTDFVKVMGNYIATGAGLGASELTQKYEGSYSAARQEMVNQAPIYAARTNNFINVISMPAHVNMVTMADFAGLIDRFPDLDRSTLTDAAFRGPVLPWIDPKNEVEAQLLQMNAKLKSRQQIIRERGGDPNQVDKEIEADKFAQAMIEQAGIDVLENDSDETSAHTLELIKGGQNAQA